MKFLLLPSAESRYYVIQPQINHKEKQFDKPTEQEYQRDALQLATKTKPHINANLPFSSRQLEPDRWRSSLSQRGHC